MKILQIFPGKVWGGAEQYILDLGKALSDMGHELVYLCRRADAVTNRLDAEGIPYSIIERNLLSGYDKKVLKKALEGCEVVHIHDSSFVSPVVKVADNTKVILTRHIARRSRVLPWQRCYFRKLHVIIFVSDLAKSMWLEANSWMDEGLCKVILNSIPNNTYYYDVNLREKYNIPADVPILMFTGRIRKSKGCITILKALSCLKNLKWYMIFVGASKPTSFINKMTTFAESLGIAERIKFYGFSTSVRDLVNQADIGLQPSIVREALGLSQLEFMQAGKPVITTNNGAQPEYIIDGETGFLVAPDDADAMAKDLEMLLTNTERGQKVGTAARDYFQSNLSYPVFIDKILKAYE